MNDHIEQLFQQAREQEPKLDDAQFIEEFGHLRQNFPARAKLGYDWILVVAVALASVLVFLFTPLHFWVSAIPYQPFGLEFLMLISLGTLGAVIAYLLVFDRDCLS